VVQMSPLNAAKHRETLRRLTPKRAAVQLRNEDLLA
jgi:hypothetical protein